MNHSAMTNLGMQSMLFEKTSKDGKTEYAYVFAGTNSVGDLIEDVTQLVGYSPQLSKAVENATTLSEELADKELTFVGHSLGGGLSTAANMATCRDAITFNTSVVSPLSKKVHGLKERSNVTNYVSAIEIFGLKVQSDPVSNLQRSIFMNAPGKKILVPTGIIPSHSIDKLVKALSK